MLVSISGKIGSGKDTVGKIIQSITNGDHSEGTLQVIQNNYATPDTNWEIKKFADKLKDIVCLLINCTREQLEDDDFKNKELGEEWKIWYMTHYKLSNNTNEGRIGKIYSSEEELLSYESSEFFKSLRLDGYQIVSKLLTSRLLLQLLGTECGRDIIHPNIWVNSLMSEYKGRKTRINQITPVKQSFDVDTYPNWIITDTRFPNELEAVKKRNGVSIRVNRDNGTRAIDTNPHESETALDNAEFDYTIDNNGTIEELIEKVKQILIKEKII